MADSSQEQDIGDVEASAAQIAQARRDANSIQNSPNAQIQNSWSFFGGRSRQPRTIDWERATKLLERQAIDVENRLEQMLFGIAEIGLTPTPQEVAKLAATKVLRIDQANPEIIDPMRPILEVYDRSSIKGSLLILGTPGAGKTTTLLSLAQQLTSRELANIQQGSPQAMIPLIFELSTWRDDKQSIGDWLVEQLYENYGGDRKSGIYELWLKRQVLLPLLDGLDELGLVRQQKCTEALNQFAQTYPQLVVCCRVKEFRQVEVKLSNLRGAVQLEPLSDRQIESYLAAVGKSALWEQIQTVPEMHNLLQPVVDAENPDYDEPGLLRVPLFISLAAQVFEVDRPLKGKADLFDRYIDRQLSFDVRVADRRKEVQKRSWAFKTVEREPDRQAVTNSLTWIAQRLKTENQVELLIEKVQPSWLGNEKLELIYKTLYGASSGIFLGVTLTLYTQQKVVLLPFFTGTLINDIMAGLIIGIAAAWAEIFTEEISLFEWGNGRRIVNTRKKPHLLVYMCVGIAMLATGILLSRDKVFVAMMFSSLFLVNLAGYVNQESIQKNVPNQGVRKSLRSSFVVSLIVSFTIISASFIGVLYKQSHDDEFIAIMHDLSRLLRSDVLFRDWIFLKLTGGFLVAILGLLIFFLPAGFILVGAATGGITNIQHLSLRIVLTRHYGIPWNLARFLTYCHDRRLLQQIGGRYRFIHRELLDHFARIEN